jgi:hypothetical protein
VDGHQDSRIGDPEVTWERVSGAAEFPRRDRRSCPATINMTTGDWGCGFIYMKATHPSSTSCVICIPALVTNFD